MRVRGWQTRVRSENKASDHSRGHDGPEAAGHSRVRAWLLGPERW